MHLSKVTYLLPKVC